MFLYFAWPVVPLIPPGLRRGENEMCFFEYFLNVSEKFTSSRMGSKLGPVLFSVGLLQHRKKCTGSDRNSCRP